MPKEVSLMFLCMKTMNCHYKDDFLDKLHEKRIFVTNFLQSKDYLRLIIVGNNHFAGNNQSQINNLQSNDGLLLNTL